MTAKFDNWENFTFGKFNLSKSVQILSFIIVGTELGQAQLKLGLDFTLIICKFGFSPLELIKLV